MNPGILIVGSGFAARQLVKNLRRLNSDVPIRLIAADSCDEYNKPELSHVISQNQTADALTRQTCGSFAEQFQLRLHPNTRITDIDTQHKRVCSGEQSWQYDKLVLAVGASAIVPPVTGNELMLTLNSQQEYRDGELALLQAQRVLILGGGLIGCELAMDMCRAGKQVTLVDRSGSLLSALMPIEASSRLQHCLQQMGVEVLLNQQLSALIQQDRGLQATLGNGRQLSVDAAIASVGLHPNVGLARQANLQVDRGIRVNNRLQTSQIDVYALGDCAEIDGQLLPFLQPIQFSAMALAKNLLGAEEGVKLPAMLVKVKTPNLPLHLAGETHRQDLSWNIVAEQQGMIAKGFDRQQQLRAFIVSEDHMKLAFGLLKELNTLTAES
ncbi:Nitric oxide reductase FlRd-NAD(+) reductase [Serratia proteamaculans]|jgi:nitric oxide reductase FlRd-NAD(+) reductase|uniref:Nitric oxide reductase FlRd-NAD(+) reductase n=1 Tax=Serratia proteamaculans TaxID=28151 RepID=A0ABS0TMV8_SERPR|nr:NADH:flavorubredoxin reductase NorW [Serratia proteamaculans]KAB1499101.1 NADH:flavorubredoxin reductase NorW [Serratia proteamaculans]MBI6179685.1 NADH:flavorubredoxin reductase NorW [Serratia proteamaculans]RYM53191.1 FAD-dependent oxidoreductase [Serratia proteamaculans]CAI0739877.1 Nitric oxide reductase FlRd-NAD(+) reductase [Serratia proteamaculans]CAI0830967.1 Nitric oxide reductase FlRd-NAD(+) reductase [Serratia proteamaculans]